MREVGKKVEAFGWKGRKRSAKREGHEGRYKKGKFGACGEHVGKRAKQKRRGKRKE